MTISPELEQLLTENCDEVWGYAMGKIKAGVPDAWGETMIGMGLATSGATSEEVSKFIYALTSKRARAKRAQMAGEVTKEVSKSIEKLIKGAEAKDILRILKAEQRAIEKRIKEMENSNFDGKYFRVRPPAEHGKPLFRVQSSVYKITIAYLQQKEANELAKRLEDLFMRGL